MTGIKFGYKKTLKLSDWFEIQEDYGKGTGIKNEKWWLEPSEFGKYFLNEAGVKGIDDEKWSTYYPAFEYYFPTEKEYALIVQNVRFLNGIADGVNEDRYYTLYVFLREFGLLSVKEIENFPLKKGLMLYYYTMGNHLIKLANSIGYDGRKDNELVT